MNLRANSLDFDKFLKSTGKYQFSCGNINSLLSWRNNRYLEEIIAKWQFSTKTTETKPKMTACVANESWENP